MSEDKKKEFHDNMFELRLKQAYYVMEHKKDDPEIIGAIKQLRREYAKTLIEEREDNKEGEGKNVKH